MIVIDDVNLKGEIKRTHLESLFEPVTSHFLRKGSALFPLTQK
jgi:hypothetical protein